MPLSPVHWEALAERTASLSSSLCAGDILVVYNALRSSGHRDRELQRLLHERLQQLPPAAFAATEVRDLLRVLQQCGWRGVRTLRHLAAAFLRSVSAASPSCCRELMAAYARLRVSLETETDQEAFAAAAQRLLQQAASLGPKEVSMALNCTVRCTDTATMTRFVSSLASQIPRVAAAMRPMQLSLTANALAAAAARNTPALRAIEKAALQKRDTWGPQDVALLVNAFARLELYSQSLLDAAAQHVREGGRLPYCLFLFVLSLCACSFRVSLPALIWNP